MSEQTVEVAPLKWGLFMPYAYGPFGEFDTEGEALSALAAGPREAHVAPILWCPMCGAQGVVVTDGTLVCPRWHGPVGPLTGDEREVVHSAVHKADDRLSRTFALLDVMREVAARPEMPELEVLAAFMRWADAHREKSVEVSMDAVIRLRLGLTDPRGDAR